jgi:hypothetical protein
MNNARIMELMAQAQNEAASAQTEQAYAQVAIINTEISRVKSENEQLSKRVDQLLAMTKIQSDHHLGQLKKASAAK